MEGSKRIFKLYLFVLILIISTSLFLSCFFTISRGNGISMSHTLENGDITLELKNLRILNIEPERGDII
ncbi:MAG: hypothetical protein GX069_09815, partial [Tissierellia bacterium]|nr:hypothetical protein [Tissierellia bacterium]